MIVKILLPSATFKGVSYNTNKIEKDKGELMKVENFGALQALEHLKPKDYINYLEARSKTSARIKYPQFHAVISCKGKSHSKEQLTEIATGWLKGMGYGEQPYLLVFHKDTDNNHIHIVSTHVDENGKKINDSYEKIRAYQVLNQVMGLDQKEQVTKDLDKALSYHFSTRPQFMMLLESQGYTLKLNGGRYALFKYGKQQGDIDAAKVDARISLYQQNINRLAQLRAITEKYKASHNPAVIPVTVPLPGGKAAKPTGYTSELAELLASKFGMQVLFHGKAGMPPYGYTLIDHAQKTVYKGGELMPITEFIRPSDSRQTEREQPVAESPEPIAAPSPAVYVEADEQEETVFPAGQDQPAEVSGYAEEPVSASWLPEINLDIADDIDDEAILGRNRQRKRKARTNTR
ncbi:relaxase/mobilization nuclease-like protein [Arcticibacter tournemirensis]|uniref:Relaxase/mobilization nuclease domain-containing protein n=1 Tax=Arcticibacter tournemirensis TaxID=699437 RepID=A0A5M9GT91_9SPHI|nr:relaxase/mobilization nuclease domain-containing protein [Arcticibacter tournemirensis]KAA8476857.1 relaxase/mobilization nuclease domain-containing protein [Arcticibacter tournemirensis]TQM49571.1 relaxase/mobilization nuclease-like protein [Arcticibacter tournemirensis]